VKKIIGVLISLLFVFSTCAEMNKKNTKIKKDNISKTNNKKNKKEKNKLKVFIGQAPWIFYTTADKKVKAATWNKWAFAIKKIDDRVVLYRFGCKSTSNGWQIAHQSRQQVIRIKCFDKNKNHIATLLFGIKINCMDNNTLKNHEATFEMKPGFKFEDIYLVTFEHGLQEWQLCSKTQKGKLL